MGRRGPQPREDRRHVRSDAGVSVRLSPHERETLERAAQAEGVSIGELLRSGGTELARRILRDPAN